MQNIKSIHAGVHKLLVGVWVNKKFVTGDAPL